MKMKKKMVKMVVDKYFFHKGDVLELVNIIKPSQKNLTEKERNGYLVMYEHRVYLIEKSWAVKL